MSNLQITLSIIGVLLIIAIIGHGLWTMRRNSQKVSRQAEDVAAKRQRATAEPRAFDDDGIGEVRVVKKRDAAKPETAAPEVKQTPSPTATDDDIEQMSMNLDLDDDDTPLPSMRVDKDDAEALQQAEFELNANDDIDPDVKRDRAHADDGAAAPVEQPATEPKSEAEPEPEVSEPAPAPKPAQEVISLFVKGSVQGAVLLQMMTELGCKFGDMGIFHRYEQTSGNGPLIFSVANMFNPGTFDLDNIENFETEGVALFMTLPMDYDGQQAFNMMLNAAKKLAMEIPQGQVLDGQRQVLSRQSIQKAHQTIREFEKAQSGSL